MRSALEERGGEKILELGNEGLIQRFEFCYELAWKTMKDYLDEQRSKHQSSNITYRDQRSICSKIITVGQVGWI